MKFTAKQIAAFIQGEIVGNENAEVFEGQVFMTEEELSKFEVPEKDVLAKVVEKGTK